MHSIKLNFLVLYNCKTHSCFSCGYTDLIRTKTPQNVKNVKTCFKQNHQTKKNASDTILLNKDDNFQHSNSYHQSRVFKMHSQCTSDEIKNAF